MATHLGQTSLGANTFLAGCVSMVMINISAALIHLLPSSLGQPPYFSGAELLVLRWLRRG